MKFLLFKHHVRLKLIAYENRKRDLSYEIYIQNYVYLFEIK